MATEGVPDHGTDLTTLAQAVDSLNRVYFDTNDEVEALHNNHQTLANRMVDLSDGCANDRQVAANRYEAVVTEMLSISRVCPALRHETRRIPLTGQQRQILLERQLDTMKKAVCALLVAFVAYLIARAVIG